MNKKYETPKLKVRTIKPQKMMAGSLSADKDKHTNESLGKESFYNFDSDSDSDE